MNKLMSAEQIEHWIKVANIPLPEEVWRMLKQLSDTMRENKELRDHMELYYIALHQLSDGLWSAGRNHEECVAYVMEYAKKSLTYKKYRPYDR